jgi:hypothetical protein
MAIYATCPDCDMPQKLRDDQEGKKVKCKECGSSFKAIADEEEPRRKSRAKDDEEDERPRRGRGGDDEGRGGISWGLIAGLIGGGVLLIGLVVLVVVLLRPPQQTNAGGDAGKKDAAKDGTKAAGKDGTKDGNKDGGKLLLSPHVVVPAEANLTLERPCYPVYGAVSSANVVLSLLGDEGKQPAFGVFALDNGRKLVEVEFPRQAPGFSPAPRAALSPDGSRVAFIAGERSIKDRHDRDIYIYAVPGDGKPLKKFLPHPKGKIGDSNTAVWLDFIDNDRLLILTEGSRATLYSISADKNLYDEKPSGARLGTDIPGYEPKEFAISPDRRVLAIMNQFALKGAFTVALVDTSTGKAIGTLPAPANAMFSYSSLAFSPDGKTLATIITTNLGSGTRDLVTWDVEGRKLKSQTTLLQWKRSGTGLRWWGNDHILWRGDIGSVLLNVTTAQAVRHVTASYYSVVPGTADGKLRLVLRNPDSRKPTLTVYPAPDTYLASDRVIDDGSGRLRRMSLTAEGVDRRDLYPPQVLEDRIPLPKR